MYELLEGIQFMEFAQFGNVAMCTNLPKEMKGMAEGHEYVLDVASMLKDSWDDIPMHHIVHCWVKASFPSLTESKS